MHFDREELSWKSRHDGHAPASAAWRLVLALVVIAGAAIAAQVESSPRHSHRARVAVSAAATPEAP
jgi:hypothetical protein